MDIIIFEHQLDSRFYRAMLQLKRTRHSEIEDLLVRNSLKAGDFRFFFKKKCVVSNIRFRRVQRSAPENVNLTLQTLWSAACHLLVFGRF